MNQYIRKRRMKNFISNAISVTVLVMIAFTIVVMLFGDIWNILRETI